MDDLLVRLCAANSRISMPLFDFPVDIISRKIIKLVYKKCNNHYKFDHILNKMGFTCRGWRVATAQNECAPRLWNVPIIATRACLTFNGTSAPLNALLMLTVYKLNEKIIAGKRKGTRREEEKKKGTTYHIIMRWKWINWTISWFK